MVGYTLEQRWEIPLHYFENHDNVCLRSETLVAVVEINCRSQQLNISETLLRRIFHKDLIMTPYKVQLVQELKPIEHPMCFRFAKWAL